MGLTLYKSGLLTAVNEIMRGSTNSSVEQRSSVRSEYGRFGYACKERHGVAGV